MADLDALRAEFAERFSASPRFFQAPGRVNLIGEHTDYNAGFVMPAAIGFYTTVAIAPRLDQRLRVRSTNFSETVESELPQGRPPQGRRSGAQALWIDYVLGVAGALERYGVALGGADLLIHGEVPLGAGLSSSAALEMAVGLAFTSLAGRVLEKVTLAKICQQAENEYVGMRCGIMDQFASACGRAGHALMIDCRSLQYELLPFGVRTAAGGAAVQLVICNTMVRHRLAGGDYNRRREECEQAVRALQRFDPQVQALRDVTPALLEAHKDELGPLLYRRCRHVVTENERVLAAAAALKSNNLDKFGELMRESHQSLRDDYEVSCDELDVMVRLAESMEGVYGARMTGGGFGGCTVNLVRTDATAEFRFLMSARYAAATGHTPEIYICEPADGAAAVDEPG